MKSANHLRHELPAYDRFDLDHRLDVLLNSYQKNGIVYLKDFIDTADRESIMKEISKAQCDAEDDLRKNWHDRKVCFFSRNAAQSTEQKEYASDPYFLSSGSRAHVFYELADSAYFVNRIGHGLHLCQECPTIAKTVYERTDLKKLLLAFGYIRPICQLSVYIPKHADEVGSDVRPHQESTFAHTEPQTAVVLWIALEDALIDNACMWGILGSNHWPLKYVSRVDHSAKRRHFEKINEVDIPEFDPKNEIFTPLPVASGDALIFHGNFVHCSPINTSHRSRAAISFQFLDTASTIYSDSNWLQPPNTKHLYNLAGS